MELELGLKVTRTREDVSSSVDFRFSKDPFGPLVLSRETDSRFIIIIHLKGFKKEGIEIDINKEGDKITIRGRKPVEEMVMIRWMAWRKEVEMRVFKKVFLIPDVVDLDKIKARFDDDDATLTITMPKRVRGISGFNLEQEEEEEEGVTEVENREEVEEENEEREESDEHSEIQGEEDFGEMVEDEERESQVFEGEEESFSGGVDETQIEQIGQQELADSDTESEDNVLKKLPDIMEQDNQEVVEKKVSEEIKKEEIGSGAIEEIKEQESHEDKQLPDIREQEDNQEVIEKKVSEEIKSDDTGSGAVEEIEKQESDETGRTSNSRVMEKKKTEDGDNDGLRKTQGIEEPERHNEESKIQEMVEEEETCGQEKINNKDSKREYDGKETQTEDDNLEKSQQEEKVGQHKCADSNTDSEGSSSLRKLPDSLEQENNQDSQVETQTDDSGSGEFEEIEKQEPHEQLDGASKGIKEPERQNEVSKTQEMVEGETSDHEKRKNVKMETKSKDPEEDVDEMGERFTPVAAEDNTEETETKAEKLDSIKPETDKVDKKEEEEENTKVRRESDDSRSLIKLQENEEQHSKGPKRQDKHDIKELVEEKTEASEVGSVVKTDDEGKEKKKTGKMETAPKIAEIEAKPEDFEPEKLEADELHKLVEMKEEEVANVREKGEDSILTNLQENEEQHFKGRKGEDKQENIKEFLEEKAPDAETNIVNDVLKPVQETEPEVGTLGEVMEQKVSEETKSDNIGSGAVEEIEEQESDGGTSKSRAMEKQATDGDDVDGLRKAHGTEEPERHNEESKITGGQEKNAKEESSGIETQTEDEDVEKSQQTDEQGKILESAEEKNVGQQEFADSVTESEDISKPPDIIEQGSNQDVMDQKDSQEEPRSDGSGAFEEVEKQEPCEQLDATSKSREMADDGGLIKVQGTEEPERRNEVSKIQEKVEEDPKEDVDAEMGEGFTPNIERTRVVAETETRPKEFVSEKPEADKVDQKHEQHSKGRKRQDKQENIQELVEEKTPEAETNMLNDVPEPVQETEAPENDIVVKTDNEGKEKKKSVKMETAPNIAETETGPEDFESEKLGEDEADKIHKPVEKKEEEVSNVRPKGEDRSLNKLQEDEEPHSKGRKRQQKQENIKELVEEKTPEAETYMANDVPKPVQEIKVPEVGTLGETSDEGKQGKEKKSVANIVETETKLEDSESDKVEADEVDKIHKLDEKKDETNTEVGTQSEDRSSIKPQEVGEKQSQGQKTQEKIKELVGEKTPEAETTIQNDTPKPVQEKTNDAESRKPQETIRQQEMDECEKESKTQELVKSKINDEEKEGKEIEERVTKEQDSYRPNVLGEEENVQELAEEKTHFLNDRKLKDEEEVSEKKTELGDDDDDDDISRKPGDLDAKEEVDAEMGIGIAPNIAETETKPEDFESEKVGEDEVEKIHKLVEKKEEEDANVRAKGSLIKLQEIEEPHSKGRKGQVKQETIKELVEEKAPEVETNEANNVPKPVQEIEPELGTLGETDDTEKEAKEKKKSVADIAETEKKPEEFESDQLKADKVDRIHELVEKKREEEEGKNAKVGTESEEQQSQGQKKHDKQAKIEELVEEKTPVAETNRSNDTLKPVRERGEGKEKTPKLFQEERKKQPEEHKEKTVETGEKFNDGVGSRKVEETIRQQELGEPEECKKDRKTVEVVKSITKDEKETEARKSKEQESYRPKILEEQEKIQELAEEKMEFSRKVKKSELGDEDTSRKARDIDAVKGQEEKEKNQELVQEEKVSLEVRDRDAREEVDVKMGVPNIAVAETKPELESDQLKADEVDKIHAMVEKKKKEEEEKDAKVGTQSEDISLIKPQETGKQQSQGQMQHHKQEKIEELVEEQTPEEETHRSNDTLKPGQERCEGKEKTPKRFQEETKKQPEEHKEKMVEAENKIGDAGSRKVQETIVQKDLDEPERCEKESKILEVVKSKTNDEENDEKETAEKKTEFGDNDDHHISRNVGDAEQRDSDSKEEVDAEMGEGFTPDIAEAEKKADELVERKKEENATGRKKSEEQKFQGPNRRNKQENTKELVEEKPEAETVKETEKPKVERLETCEEKVVSETETKDQESYRPKILEGEDKIQELAEKKMNVSRKVEEKEENAEKKTDIGDAMKGQEEEKEEFQELVLEEKASDGGKKIVGKAIDKSRKVQEIDEQKSHEEEKRGSQFQKLRGETSGQGEVEHVESEKKTTEVDKRLSDSAREAKADTFPELQEEEKEDEADIPENGEKTQELVDENINNGKEEETQTKTDDVIRKVQGTKEEELFEPKRNHVSKTEEVIEEKISEAEREAECGGLSKVEGSKEEESNEPNIPKERYKTKITGTEEPSGQEKDEKDKVVESMRLTEKENFSDAQEIKDQRPDKERHEKRYEIPELVEAGHNDHKEEKKDEKLIVKAKQETEEDTSKKVHEIEHQESDGLNISLGKDKKQETEEKEISRAMEEKEPEKTNLDDKIQKQKGEDKIHEPVELGTCDHREKVKKQDGDDILLSVEQEKGENMVELEGKVEDESSDKFHEFEERKSDEDWTHETGEKSKEEATDPKEEKEKTRAVEETEIVERMTGTRDGSLRKAQDDSEPELSKPYKPQEEDKVQESVERGTSDNKQELKKQDGNDTTRSKELVKPSLIREEATSKAGHSDHKEEQNEEKVITKAQLKAEEDNSIKVQEIENQKSDELHRSLVQETEEKEETKAMKENEIVERRTKTSDVSLRKVQDDADPELSKPYKSQEEENVHESVVTGTSDYREKVKKQDGNDTLRSKEICTSEAKQDEKVITKAELKAEEDTSEKAPEIEKQKPGESQRSLVQETKEKEQTRAVEENEILERRTKTEEGSLREVQDGKEAESSKPHKRRDEDKIKELVEMKTSDYREKVKTQDGDDISRSQETEKLDLVEEEETGPKDNNHTGWKGEPEEERYEKVTQTKTKFEDEMNKEVEENQKEEEDSLDDPMRKTQESEKEESHEPEIHMVQDFVEEERRGQEDETAAVEANYDEEHEEDKEKRNDPGVEGEDAERIAEKKTKEKEADVQKPEGKTENFRDYDGESRRGGETFETKSDYGIVRKVAETKVQESDEKKDQELESKETSNHGVKLKTEEDRLTKVQEMLEKDSSKRRPVGQENIQQLMDVEKQEDEGKSEAEVEMQSKIKEEKGREGSEKVAEMEMQAKIGITMKEKETKRQEPYELLENEEHDKIPEPIVKGTKYQREEEKRVEDREVEEMKRKSEDVSRKVQKIKAEEGDGLEKHRKLSGFQENKSVEEEEVNEAEGYKAVLKKTKYVEDSRQSQDGEEKGSDQTEQENIQELMAEEEEEEQNEEAKRIPQVESKPNDTERLRGKKQKEDHQEVVEMETSDQRKEEREEKIVGEAVSRYEYDISRKNHENEEEQSDQIGRHRKEEMSGLLAKEETSNDEEENRGNRAGAETTIKDEKKQLLVENDTSGKEKESRDDSSRKTREDEKQESHEQKRNSEEQDKKSLGPNYYRSEEDGKEEKEILEAEGTRKSKGIEQREATKMNNQEKEDKESLSKSEDHESKEPERLRKQDKGSELVQQRSIGNLKDEETTKTETEVKDQESRKTHQQLIEKEEREAECEDGSSKKIQEIDKEGTSEPRRDEERDKIQPVDRDTSEDEEEEELEVEVEDSEEDWEAEVVQEMDSDEDNDELRQIRRIKLGFRLVGGSTLFMSLIVIVISIIRSKRKTRCYKF